VYTWAVNSIVTKHSDFFVSKDTAECVTDAVTTPVDKTRVNSCVSKHLFLKEVSNKKIAN